MRKRTLLAAMTALLSAGWLLPLALGVDFYLGFWQAEGWPLLAGEKPLNSFPFIEAARRCSMVAFVWLGLVVVFWSYAGVSALARRRME